MNAPLSTCSASQRYILGAVAYLLLGINSHFGAFSIILACVVQQSFRVLHVPILPYLLFVLDNSRSGLTAANIMARKYLLTIVLDFLVI